MGAINLINGILLVIALTTDSFVVSFAYGIKKIKMPFKIVAGMNFIMSAFLGLAVWAGNFLSSFLSEDITRGLGGILLFAIGFYKLMEYFFDRVHEEPRKKSEKTEKTLTAAEGAALAVLLSLDGLAAGLGTGFLQSKGLILALASFVMGLFMMKAGWRLGYHFCSKIRLDLSWISGLCLMILAFGYMWKQ